MILYALKSKSAELKGCPKHPTQNTCQNLWKGKVSKFYARNTCIARIHAWIQEFCQGTCRGRQLTKKALTTVLFYKEGLMAISKKTC